MIVAPTLDILVNFTVKLTCNHVFNITLCDSLMLVRNNVFDFLLDYFRKLYKAFASVSVKVIVQPLPLVMSSSLGNMTKPPIHICAFCVRC